jgi:hypothetical protein
MMIMRERRETFRIEWNSLAMMYDCDGRFARACFVRNFSNGGAKITGIEIAAIADEFMLRITPHSRLRKCRVVWRSKDSLGVAFADSPDSAGQAAIGRRQKRVASA